MIKIRKINRLFASLLILVFVTSGISYSSATNGHSSGMPGINSNNLNYFFSQLNDLCRASDLTLGEHKENAPKSIHFLECMTCCGVSDRENILLMKLSYRLQYNVFISYFRAKGFVRISYDSTTNGARSPPKIT